MNFSRGEIDGKEGIGLLQQILDLDPDLPVIFITAYGEFHLAVRAIKAGAYHFPGQTLEKSASTWLHSFRPEIPAIPENCCYLPGKGPATGE